MCVFLRSSPLFSWLDAVSRRTFPWLFGLFLFFSFHSQLLYIISADFYLIFLNMKHSNCFDNTCWHYIVWIESNRIESKKSLFIAFRNQVSREKTKRRTRELFGYGQRRKQRQNSETRTPHHTHNQFLKTKSNYRLGYFIRTDHEQNKYKRKTNKNEVRAMRCFKYLAIVVLKTIKLSALHQMDCFVHN